MTAQIKNDKAVYSTPEISCILIDNEISLALESDPPGGDGENTTGMNYQMHQNDPFKTNQV